MASRTPFTRTSTGALFIMPDSAPHLLPESSFKRDRLGLTTIGLRYLIKGGTADDGSDEPWDTLHDYLPSQAPLGLGYMDRDAKKQTDGDWILGLNYDGARDEQALGAFAEIDYSRVDSPVETFERFEDLRKFYKGRLENNQVVWPVTIKDPDSGKQVKNPMFGQSHFPEANVVLRTALAVKNFDRSLFENMCKTWTPPVPKGQEEIREVENELEKWLKASIKAGWRGNVWSFSIESLLGRWNPYIHSPRNTTGESGFRSGVDNPQGGIAGGAFA